MKEKKRYLIISVIILIVIFFFVCKASNLFLIGKINWNLWRKYGTGFVCENVIVEGYAANFSAYPFDDPSLRFTGLADSRDGSIEFDEYVGAILAKEDTKVFSEIISDSLGESFIYGSPVIRNGRFIGQYEAKLIKSGNFSIDQLYCLSSGYKFFYIFINTSDDRYVYDPGSEYDLLNDSINEMSQMYYDVYGKEVCAVMHIYFVDEDLFDYSKEYFKTHTEVTHAFNLQVSPNNRVVVEMGSLQEYSSGNLRMTRDEYIEKRERMNQAC